MRYGKGWKRVVIQRRAFTLIEAITAVLVLGVAMPSMLAALASAHQARVTPIKTSQARWLAMERLEDVIADRASPERGWAYLVTGNYPTESTVPDFPGFARTTTLTETESDLVTPGEGYMTAAVTVSWIHEQDTPLSVTLTTVLTERPE